MTASIARNRLIDLARPDGVGPIWCDGHEILQRIFVTVRDQHWREIAPTDSKRAIDETLGIATLAARHESDTVAFEWKGRFRVSDDGRELRFEFSGRVLRDMHVCRVGLVVLHPVDSMVGSHVIATAPRSAHEFTPTEIIAPQPVMSGIPAAMTEPFVKLVIERADFGRLDLTFEGDSFELEDQRNWGDASFKTYCTPLRLGFPRALKAGTVIQHSVEIRLTPPGTQSKAALAGYRGGEFPQLGLEWSRAGETARALNELELTWSHLHFNAGTLENLTELRETLAAEEDPPLHIGFEVQDDGSLDKAIALFTAHRKRISRLFLYGPGTSVPSAAAISHCRLKLENAAKDWDIPLSAATSGYFVELNRGVPFSLPVSGIAFPLTATVHSDDPETISGNVVAIQDMAQTALRLTGSNWLSITPLALHYPASRMTQQFPTALVTPWLVATLIHAALGGVNSVTLARDILSSIVTLRPGGIDFISRLADLSGREVARLAGGLPQSLHAVKFISAAASEPQVLAANMSSNSVEISLSSLGKGLRTATDAVTGRPLDLHGGSLIVPGYGVTLVGY